LKILNGEDQATLSRLETQYDHCDSAKKSSRRMEGFPETSVSQSTIRTSENANNPWNEHLNGLIGLWRRVEKEGER
jgi:hypothetical protein